MAKQVHGDPNIDTNTDKVLTWFETSVNTDFTSYLRNLDKKRLERFRNTIGFLAEKLEEVDKFIDVRRRQSPSYVKNMEEEVKKGILNLS